MEEQRKEPTLFQGFWHGDPLPPLLRAAIASFIAHGHRFDLYCYDDFDVPAGVTVRDANEILPDSDLFAFDNPSMDRPDLGPFSDLFRFKLLSDNGGWYMDVDTFCLSDDIPAFERAWARENPEMSPKAIGAGQIAFPAGDATVRLLYERCRERSRDFKRREALGPNLISEVIDELGLPKDMNGDTPTFYPVQWIETFMLWLPEYAPQVRERLAGAKFLPFYMSLPRYMGIGVDLLPPADSLLGDLCDRYEPGPAKGPRHDADDVRRLVRAWFAANEPWAANELRTVAGEGAVARLGLDRADPAAVSARRREPAVTQAGDTGGSSSMETRTRTHIEKAVANLDDAITALFRERERLIDASTKESEYQRLVAPFSTPFAVAERRPVRAFEQLTPGFLVGYAPDSGAIAFVMQTPKADNALLSPPDHHFVLKFDLEDPGTTNFWTVERHIDSLDATCGYRVTVALKARTNQPASLRFELSIPQAGDPDIRHDLGSVQIAERFDPIIISQVVDLAKTPQGKPDPDRNPSVIMFLPVGSGVNVELAYYNLLVARAG